MDRVSLIERLHQGGESRIVLVVIDGLGGLPQGERGSELEAAATPNLDRLACEGVTGLLTPVLPGITPGSGPGHLALFGYDPLELDLGRGVLTALGIDFDLRREDVAARGNFCTLDDEGRVSDRRAGRISSERGAELARELDAIELEGVDLFVEPVAEHRFLLVLRGEGLGAAVTDTDPQTTGVPSLEPQGSDEGSRRTAELVAELVDRVRERLAGREPANGVLLRGFERLPEVSSMSERYGLRGCALAGYPMYRGVARLLGMVVIECGPDLDSEIEALHDRWQQHDFFFLHWKEPDSRGEDGDFEAKKAAIEELDRALPRIVELEPEVLVVTGDHSTPSQLRRHSWHPVPVLLHAATARRDDVSSFGETACAHGALSTLPARDLMAIALAHAGRLSKYGA